jgi:ribosomal protein S18 acetylase RimI-like enzyme
MQIRKATTADYDAVWAILEPIIRGGETYALPSEMQRADALQYWFSPDAEVFVALEDEIAGTYRLTANNRGGGAHVANCGYATARAHAGRGIGSAMCAHSLARAKERGFRAMQFNFVISTNDGAVRLWERFGFKTVGRLPEAFAHPKHGYVDVLVMFRTL